MPGEDLRAAAVRRAEAEVDALFDRIFDEALGRAFGFVPAPPLHPFGVSAAPPSQPLTVAMLVEAARWLNERMVDDPLDIDPRFQVAPRRPLEDLVQSVLEYEGLDEEDEP